MATKAARPTATPLKVTREAPPSKGAGEPALKVPLEAGAGAPVPEGATIWPSGIWPIGATVVAGA